MSVRILVVDDADVTRRMVRAMVRDTPGLSVCGEAGNAATGLQKFNSLKPEVVVVDLSLPDITGLEVARLMTSADPKVPLILFTILKTEGLEDAAKQAGIRAIVPKTEAWDLISIINAEVSRSN